MSDRAYDQAFYALLDGTAYGSAGRVLPALFSLLGGVPATVADVGCGDGGWLRACLDAGAARVIGFDGPWVALDQLKIPAACFHRRDLDQPLALPDGMAPCDLALSLEVAEHLPAARAPGFVADLCAMAPVVLFSAAPPGQGGLHHINEQWPAYWESLFAAHDYVAVDTLRWQVWNDPDVTWWYKQNLLLFVRADRLAGSPALQAARARTVAPLPGVAHPDLFAAKLRLAEPRFGRWLKMGRGALSRSLRPKTRT